MMLACGAASPAAQPVLQRGYDAGVTGANLSETTLNTSNVAPSTFGLLFKLPVDDAVFAQPLYVPNVAIAGQGTHNVVYVATMSDSLYAFDADSGGAPLWSINLATRVGAMPVPFAKFVFSGDRNIVGNLGILSTPVIDLATSTLYLVACTLENNTMVYRLHAVDIASGAARAGSGVLITGSFGGSVFDGRYQTQRVSLVLSGNQVVFGFGAVELEYAGGYVGWVMAYDKTSLQQSGVFATVTTGTRGGGVWQAGRPPMVDSAGYVYVFVGNGYTNGYDGVHNFSESVLKLDPAKGLALVDWFTPGNWSALDAQDLDLSSSGPLLVPGTSLLAGGGKTGDLYVLNTANLGKFNSNDSQVVQKQHISASMFKGGPVYWQRSAANGGPLLYNWGELDAVKAYPFNGTRFAANPSSVGTGGNQITPGGILTLSANGEQHGSGVLWATIATSGNAEDNPPAPGALHAFDAEDLTRDLWNSNGNAVRDGFGNFAKFVPPLVVNGRVYVATWSNQVAVYGLLTSYTLSSASLNFGSQQTNVASAPLTVTLRNTGSVALPITSIAPSPGTPFAQTNNCGNSVAVAASCIISVVFDPAVTGPATATLNVTAGNDAGTQTVALAGTGAVPGFSLSPGTLDFGSLMVNAGGAAATLTLTNTGSVPVPITGITLSAPGPFSQTNTCASSVAVAASCTISVVFDPTTVGNAAATLSVITIGSLTTVNLSGTGSFVAALTASAGTVSAGVPVSLSWTSTPGATCTASGGIIGDGWSGAFGDSGNQPVTEVGAGSYTYTLTCVALGVSETASVTVAVVVPSVILTAAPTAIMVGQAVTLTWSSANATSCDASGGVSGDGWASTKPANGTATVTPLFAGVINYAMTCTSGPDSARASVQVSASSPPAPNGGGGAPDALSLLALLTMTGLRLLQDARPLRSNRRVPCRPGSEQ